MSKTYRMIHEMSSEVKFASYQIMERYGLLLRGKNLAKVLGYPSTDAMRMAINKGKCPVKTGKDKYGGYKSTAYDIAEYIVKTRREINL